MIFYRHQRILIDSFRLDPLENGPCWNLVNHSNRKQIFQIYSHNIRMHMSYVK